MMYPLGGGGWGLMSIGMVLIWAPVIIGVVIAVCYLLRADGVWFPSRRPAAARTDLHWAIRPR